MKASHLVRFLLSIAVFIPVHTASAEQLQVYAFGSYETAGVIITLPPGTNGNETARVFIKGPGDATHRPGHDFVRYDANNMATSFFDLAPDTEYDIRVEYDDPDGLALNSSVVVRTKVPFAMPTPTRVVLVNPGPAGTNSLQNAINAAVAGDEIRVRPGVYGPIRITDRLIPSSSPIVVRADDPANKPIIDGGATGSAVSILESSYWIIDGLEARNGGTLSGGGKGVVVDASAHIVVQNCFIHDNGYYNLLINHDYRHPGGITQGGYHLIQGNTISTARHGIQLDNGAGAGTVIRGNTVSGHWDNIKLCGNEDSNLDGSAGGGRELAENTPHVLALTGGIWGEHDIDFYDNTTFGAQDNDIELDGIGVNVRVYRNQFISNNFPSPFSIAPSMPGPFFVVRNLMKGTWTEAAVKMNTNGNAAIPERNVFLYHNTIVKTGGTGRASIYLWYDLPGDHNVPVKNIVFRNNVITSQVAGVQATDAGGKSLGQTNPSFNFDLWYVPGAPLANLYEWQSGATALNFNSLAAFQAGTSQELNGLFADPLLDAQFRLLAGSPAINRAQRLPGINDIFSGTTPDLGAYEFAQAPPANTAPSVNAGNDFTVTLPNNGSLQGTASDDGLPNPPAALTSQWSKVSGPGTVTFGNAAAGQTSASFSTAGSYLLRLTVSDGALSTSDDVAATVQPAPVVNQPPTVNAGTDFTITLPNGGTLQGTANDDGLPNPPGALTRQWSKVSGPGTVTFGSGTALQTGVSFSASGSYVLRLTVNDGALSTSDDVAATVEPAPVVNQRPTVNAGNDFTITLPSSGTLQGTANDDGLPNPPGALTRQWSKVSGPGTVTFGNATALQTGVSFSVSGSYVLRLTVSDGALSAGDDVSVTVQPAPVNKAPVVSAGPNQTVNRTGSQTTVQLAGSVQDDGLPVPPGALTIQWTKTSGPGSVVFQNASNPATRATFSQAGTYGLRLRASDGARTTTDNVTIRIRQ